MMPWTSFWAFGVIITITPLPVLSENVTSMVRASTHPRFRTALNMQCFVADIDNECHSYKYLRATTCSENPDCLLMKGNCGWCQCPANPRDLARFGLQPITLDDGIYLLNPASIPGNMIHVSELEIYLLTRSSLTRIDIRAQIRNCINIIGLEGGMCELIHALITTAPAPFQ